MNCTVPLNQLGFSKLASGGTSNVYISSDMRFFAKQVTNFKMHDPLSREVCLLDKLKAFHWSPKLVCVGKDYFVTNVIKKVGCADYPADYVSQVGSIVKDMQSLGIRHNDMLKDSKSDIIVDPRGVVHLTDFGWGTVDRSLMIDCVVDGRHFRSPSTRPRNRVIDRGFANIDETHHTIPCQTRFVSFRQRDGLGSQKETPRLRWRDKSVVVSGYQHFEMNATSLVLRGKSKYTYLRTHLLALRRSCRDSCRFTDIGSNTGLVSFLAERAGFTQIKALDHDAPAIDVLRQAATAIHSRVDAEVFSFGNPLPEADVVFCGALIHWVFCLTADFKGDFKRILDYLFEYVRQYLVIEWVDLKDAAIQSFQHIQRCGRDIAQKYSLTNFLDAVQTVGHIVTQAKFGTRTLMTIRARGAALP